MPAKWQLQEAKDRLSEVVERALHEGPQIVTRHGKEVVVIISKRDLERKTRRRSQKGTLVRFLTSLSFKGAHLQADRSKDTDRTNEL